jgi:hypothetical protein
VTWLPLYLSTLSLILYALFFQTAHLQGVITVSSQDEVNAVVAQLDKSKGEILTEIANLQAQVDAGQPVDLSALKAAAQGLDDLNVDPEPAPEPEA